MDECKLPLGIILCRILSAIEVYNSTTCWLDVISLLFAPNFVFMLVKYFPSEFLFRAAQWCRGQHRCLTAGSSWFKFRLGGGGVFCVELVCSPRVCLFHPQSKNMQIGVRLIGNSRLTVCVNGCLSLQEAGYNLVTTAAFRHDISGHFREFAFQCQRQIVRCVHTNRNLLHLGRAW